MSGFVQVSKACKRAKSIATKDMINAGNGAGRIEFFGGTMPLIDDANPNTLIVAITLDDPCGTVDDYGLHLTSTTPGQCQADGVITWGVVVDSDGNKVFSGSAKLITDPDANTAAFLLDKVTVYTGGFVALAAAILSEGG